MGRSYLVLSSIGAFVITTVVILSFVIIRKNNPTQDAQSSTSGFTRVVENNSNNLTVSDSCPTFSKGDFDCNGIVDLIDFDIWNREYLNNTQTLKSDVNGDGKASLYDYEIWRANYLK